MEKIGVFERVWFVRHLLERLGLNLRPVVRWLQFHEHPVLLYLVNGRAHCGVALKYLGQNVTSDHINPLLADENLTRQNLLLNFHRVLLFLER